MVILLILLVPSIVHIKPCCSSKSDVLLVYGTYSWRKLLTNGFFMRSRLFLKFKHFFWVGVFGL